MSKSRARTHAIRALMAAEGITYTRAARTLDEGRAKVKVDGREYTIQPDGTMSTRPALPTEMVEWLNTLPDGPDS